jgi:CTP synthase
MVGQHEVVSGAKDMGGTMRLGAYPARLTPGSLVAEIYGSTSVSERHRHRYEVNNAYRDVLESAGLRLSGTSPDSSLVEFVELDSDLHPFMVATQAHPEFKSRPTRPHPLFAAFVRAALDYLESERLPLVDTTADDAGVAAEPARERPELVAG